MREEAALFKALAEDTRLRIIGLLVKGELCVCDLMTILDIPQSTISRHLATLRNTGWVRDRRQGVWMYYSLDTETDGPRRELLDVLARRLAANAVARKDQENLALHLAQKKEKSCG